MCLLPSHGLPHVALRCEGRKSARSPGHQDRRNLSPRLSVSYAIASERFARPPGAHPEPAGNRWLSIRVSHLECIELTDEARTSLNLGAKGVNKEGIGVDIDGGGGSKMLEQ